MSGPRVREGTMAKIYAKHVKNLQTATAKVDNSAPRLPISVYVRDARYYGDLARLRNMDNQNRDLLKFINAIYRTKGRVDCELEKYSRKSTLHEVRLKEMEKLRERVRKFLEKLDLKFVKSQYSQTESLKFWRRMLKAMKFSAKYPEFYDRKPSHLNTWSPCPDDVTSDPDLRHVCFLDLQIADMPRLCRLEIEVYSDIVPATAANFVSLCQGFGDLSYKESPFHRIVPGLLCIGGDIVNHTGTGGVSIYGPSFPVENFTLQHNGPGVVAMYSSANETNNSQFLITFQKLWSLNGKYVVIGRVKSSYSILRMIESCGTKGGKPQQVVKVVNCGVSRQPRKESFPPQPESETANEEG